MSSELTRIDPPPMISINVPISHRFRDRRQFQSEIANFPTSCVFNAPADGVPLVIEYRLKRSKKLE